MSRLVFIILSLFSSISYGDTVDSEVTEAANAILETVQEVTDVEKLSLYSRKDQLLLAHDHLSRNDFTYWPRDRAGLSLELMNSQQRTLVHRLLLTVLSYEGYLKIANIMQLENILGPMENHGLVRGIGTYELAFYGEPSFSKPWAWRFEGHHVSLSIAVDGDAISVTPGFLGSDPSIILNGLMAGFRALPLEEDLGLKIINALNQQQRRAAIISEQPPFDLITGQMVRGIQLGVLSDEPLLKDRQAWDDWNETLEPEGIAVNQLSPELKNLVQRIVDEVVGTYRSEIAETYLETIDLNDLYFAWMGALNRGEPHYYRIQGKDFIFEYDNVQEGGNHIHTVWRDRTNDYGGTLLEKHYSIAH